jgi:hypothetical protein
MPAQHLEVRLVTVVQPLTLVHAPCCAVLCAVQVPMFSASGLRVAYLKILERRLGSQYQVEKWVRKLCKSGDFLIRT